MANHGGRDGYPWDNSSLVRPDLNHKVSSISAVSSMSSDEGHRDSVVSLPSPILGTRSHSNEQIDISHVQLSSIEGSGVPSPRRFSGSPASLPDALRVGTPPTPSSGFFDTFRSAKPSYEPVASAEGSRRGSTSSRTGSKRFSTKRKGSLLGGRQNSIPEGEEIDMGLLRNAAPMSSSPYTGYATTVEEEVDDIHGRPSVDLSSFTGPMSPRSQSQWKEINRQEQSGILTGGLGAGFTPDDTISSTDLYANVPLTPRTPGSISRRMSFRSPGLTRAPTMRHLAQIEANKTGKVIEVIVEDERKEEEDDDEDEGTGAMVDISSMTGAANTRSDRFDVLNMAKQARKETLAIPNSEVFYPQANWKPFSMRWPYLTALIVISVTLAASQEYIYQLSSKKPLYEFTSASELNTWDYFCFKYLPTMVAVTFGIMWQVTDFEVKRLEAYYQLSKTGGALAAESLNVDYITFFNFFRPVAALRYKHYAVAISSMATLVAVSLVPTLQAASVKLKPDRAQRTADPNGPKGIKIDPVWSRLLSVLLIFIAIFGCLLVWQLQKRRSGLVADVKGIAGVAAMANRSHILMDFKDMDTASPDEIHKRLKTHRYTLRNSSLAPEENALLTQAEKDKYDQQKRPGNPHPLMLRLPAGVPFIIGMLLFMIMIPLVLFQPSLNILTEKAPWLLTGLAVCIKLAWGTLETDVRMIEPFYILSLRHASPKVLTLDYTAMAFGWMPLKAFVNGHFLVALVGLGSVLAEVLTICSTSFANVSGIDFAQKVPPPPHRRDESGINAGEETFLSFWISFALAILILSFLCLVAAFVYWRRRHAFLPRQPNTIASILAFIHQSKMLYDFVGTEKMNNDEMVKRLVGIGKTYGLGWFTGRDGEMHCGVDEEELVSGYKHGEDSKKANMPWNSNWQSFD
ncbi:hypothetical protein LSUE1_G005498 [Lachnellula suecica]|uniref:Uncharacterized protein n=1 Tax=Lachnellula suecica TaxID=602035 RepID=A0A8T9C6Z9_9HELO|nr:hypothetical protein LSUE1_G005498 [Lachnellula suecica]